MPSCSHPTKGNASTNPTERYHRPRSSSADPRNEGHRKPPGVLGCESFTMRQVKLPQGWCKPTRNALCRHARTASIPRHQKRAPSEDCEERRRCIFHAWRIFLGKSSREGWRRGTSIAEGSTTPRAKPRAQASANPRLSRPRFFVCLGKPFSAWRESWAS
jgi:hypothetical protein